MEISVDVKSYEKMKREWMDFILNQSCWWEREKTKKKT